MKNNTLKLAQELRTYLNNPSNYADGLAIYNQVKISPKHDKFLAGTHPSGSMQHKLLISILTRVMSKFVLNNVISFNPANASVSIPVPVTTKQKPIVVKQNPAIQSKEVPTDVDVPNQTIRIADNPYVAIEKLPADLQLLYRQNKELYPKMAICHKDLKSAKTNVDRKKIAADLLKIESKISDNWSKIDSWAVSNKATKPVESNIMVADTTKKLKHLNNLKRYVQRETLNIRKKNISESKLAKKKQLIESWTTEIAFIEESLNIKN